MNDVDIEGLISLIKRLKLELSDELIQYALDKFDIVEKFNKICSGLPNYDGKVVYISSHVNVDESERDLNVKLFASIALDFTEIASNEYDHYDLCMSTTAIPYLMEVMSEFLE